jgi:hypothetical protein
MKNGGQMPETEQTIATSMELLAEKNLEESTVRLTFDVDGEQFVMTMSVNGMLHMLAGLVIDLGDMLKASVMVDLDAERNPEGGLN